MSTALDICRSYDGGLLTNIGQADTAFLQSVWNRVPFTQGNYWFNGMYDAYSQNIYTWTSGALLTQNLWYTVSSNQPNSLGEECGVIGGKAASPADRNGKWFDVTCGSYQRPYICEAKAGKSTRSCPSTGPNYLCIL